MSASSPKSSADTAAEALISRPDDPDWEPAADIGADVAAVLRRKLDEVRRLCEPADKAMLAKWIATLAMLTAGGRLSADDLSARVDAYVGMLEGKVRVGALTQRALDEVARRRRYFPSYAEISHDLALLGDVPAKRKERIAVLLGLPPLECGLTGYQLARRAWELSDKREPLPDPRTFVPHLSTEFDVLAVEMGIAPRSIVHHED